MKKEELKLIKPSRTWENEIKTYRAAFTNTDNGIAGTSFLVDFSDISAWLNQLALYENQDTLPKKDFVPSFQYLFIRPSDRHVLGMLNLRTALNDYLFNYAGHVGYSIAPSERQKGYGSLMLAAGLKEAKKIGIARILVTCNDTNPGSAGVIENNGGVMEDKRLDEAEQQWVRRYWIDLA